MAEFDIAISGTGLLSGLLAGLLARDHRKKVVRVGRPQSAQRLPRSLDLALPFGTRPQSWRMRRQGEAETRVLLGSAGITDGVKSTMMKVVADLPDTAAALDHIAHLAVGFGHQVGRLPVGWAFRRVATLDSGAIDKRLGEWLLAAGVASRDEGSVDATLTVLADDNAIFDGLAEADRPAPLLSQAMTSTLIVSARALPSPIRYYVDRGVTLVTRPGNTILAIVSGEREVEARLASMLAGPFPMKRLATTRYRRFITRDGAPLIGKIGDRLLIAGLGDAAPFFAPAIARLIAGAPLADEAAWFAAHDPAQDRTAIADFVPAIEVAP